MNPSIENRRRQALEIFRAGLSAVDPATAVLSSLQLTGDRLTIAGVEVALPPGRLVVVSVGKGAAPMAATAEERLGPTIAAGLAVTKDGHGHPLKYLPLRETGHPVPDRRGLEAAAELLTLADRATADDLVLCLVSGGASALLPAPVPGITLEEKQRTTRLLLGCGAGIEEINTVRKHLSRIKGGRLAARVAPARLVSLIVSDVIGNDPATIASGPTAPDDSTYADAWRVVTRYGLEEKLPATICAHLQRGIRGQVDETPASTSAVFSRVSNRVIASIDDAARAAAAAAEKLGFDTRIVTTTLQGEASLVGPALARQGRRMQSNRPCCIIFGGETTVALRGSGRGGRNQELAAAAIPELASIPGAVLLAGGTDGTDGPTEAAGGLVDSTSLDRVRERGLDLGKFLNNNDSYHLLGAIGDLLVTGPTRTNVMDLTLLLLPSRSD